MEETSEMVDRVAKAIGTACPFVLQGRSAEIMARAAIEAMRYPAGASSVPGGLAIEESMFGSEDTVFHGAAKSFNAILDAALSSSTRGK